jgi:hypothetical protein
MNNEAMLRFRVACYRATGQVQHKMFGSAIEAKAWAEKQAEDFEKLVVELGSGDTWGAIPSFAHHEDSI